MGRQTWMRWNRNLQARMRIGVGCEHKALTAVRKSSKLTIPERMLRTAGSMGSGGMAKAGTGGRGRVWRRWDELMG